MSTAVADSQEKYYLRYTIIIFLICVIPNKNYELFFILTTILLLCFSFEKKINKNYLSMTMIFFVTYLFIGSSIRFYANFENNLRDFMEIIRFLPALIIFLFLSKWKKMSFLNIIDALFLYLCIDVFVSYLQTNNLLNDSIVSLIHYLYNSDLHYDISLGYSNRSLGLSTGPGQHATLLLTILLVFFTNFFLNKKRKIISLIGVILGFYGLITTQSRSAFIAVLLTIGIFIIISLLMEKFNVKLKIIAILTVLALFIPKIISFINEQKYLMTVFLGIFNNSSYNGREEKWDRFLNMMSEQPIWLAIGYGKTFFGASSGAMDNEYLYIFSIYGVFILFILLIGIASYLIFVLINWRNQGSNPKLLFILLIGGSIMAWPASFFTDPIILFMLCLILVLIYVEKESSKWKLYKES